MIAGMMGMHAQFTISDETMELAAANKPDGVGYHIHVAEGIEDLHHCLKHYGKRIVDRLMDWGIQNIKKSFWVISFDGQSSCECTVNMFVCIDKGRHDHLALCIKKLRIRIRRLHFRKSTSLHDFCPVNHHGPAFQIWKMQSLSVMHKKRIPA